MSDQKETLSDQDALAGALREIGNAVGPARKPTLLDALCDLGEALRALPPCFLEEIRDMVDRWRERCGLDAVDWKGR